MQLTTARLKQIIKEELEAITKEMTETETDTVSEVNEVDAEIASLEQQLAEAKKKAAKMQGAKGKATKKPLGAAAHGDHKMMPAKRHDKKKGGY